MQDMHHLTNTDRDLLAKYRAEGKSLRVIARLLARSHSTIVREVQRNGTPFGYVAIAAAGTASRRKQASRAHHPLKNASTYAYVLEKLRWGWSPEQIAGRLGKEHGRSILHYETIYRYIYSTQAKEKRLWQYLPWHHGKRRIWHGRKTHRGQIIGKISIHARPEEVETRRVVGHWEGDSVVGKGKRSGLHTEVERTMRYTQALLLPNLTSEETLRAQQRIFAPLPQALRKSTTVDNGLEFAKHEELTKSLSLPVYFADPYASYQRGTNEHHNGVLRRYFPKGTDFLSITQQDVDDVVEEVNAKPRKCLHWDTPTEQFLRYTTERRGGAFLMRM